MDAIELDRMNEMVASALLGVVFSIGVVYFLHKYPGKPFDYATDRYLETASLKKKDDDVYETSNNDDMAATNYNHNSFNNQNNDDADVAKYIENMNEDDMVRSTKKMQNVFGISEDHVRKAVRQTKEDVRSGGSITDDKFSYSQILDMLVLGAVIAACVYFIDIEAHGVHGDISKVLHALFPLELGTLGVQGETRGGRGGGS